MNDLSTSKDIPSDDAAPHITVTSLVTAPVPRPDHPITNSPLTAPGKFSSNLTYALSSSSIRPSTSTSHTSTKLNQFKIPPFRDKSPVYDKPSTTASRNFSCASMQRRNSFPSTKKDRPEVLTTLRAEAKSRQEPVVKNSMQNGNSEVTRPATRGGGDIIVRSTTMSATTQTTEPPTLRNTPAVPVGGSPRVLPSTLWHYLLLELGDFEVQRVEEYKQERLSNFLRVPETFEKVSPPYAVS
jgi:hypothetical protein